MKRFLLLGENVAHSLSPALHQNAYVQLGVEATYEARSISMRDLGGYVNDMRAGVWAGINVTAPLKFAASALCDREEGPVVNTLWRGLDGAVCGANTDIAGLAAMLAKNLHVASMEDVRPAKAYVLGAGATALSAVEALRAAGFVRVVVVARDVARAERVLDRIGGAAVVAWGACSVVGSAVVVQASSAQGDEPLEALSWESSTARPVVIDVRYGANASLFAERLRGMGYVAHTGERMLAVQAAEAVQKWFGVYVDAERMGLAAFAEAWPVAHNAF